MEVTLKDILGLAKELPEKYFEEALGKLAEIKEKAEGEKEAGKQCCPHCASKAIIRNGNKHKKQAYICKGCGKSFVETTKSALGKPHSSRTVWKQVIEDTVNGISLDKTAESLDLSHAAVFHMRHKILFCVEKALIETPVELSGVCETDETYVLESAKGRKIPENYHRKARKQGAKASKPGISSEYLCVCTSITEENKRLSVSVNRAAPSKDEILEVFAGRVKESTVILCDGNTTYDVLSKKCTAAHTEHVNKANGFHNFIKGRLRAACGVASIYLNRYNALFAQVFGKSQSAVDKIFELVTSRNDSTFSTPHVRSNNLLKV